MVRDPKKVVSEGRDETRCVHCGAECEGEKSLERRNLSQLRDTLRGSGLSKMKEAMVHHQFRPDRCWLPTMAAAAAPATRVHPRLRTGASLRKLVPGLRK